MLRRYFKNYKLDYPNAETHKASKKYVKAMKKLNVRIVCLGFCIEFPLTVPSGDNSATHKVQPRVPRLTQEDLCVRPQEAHHGQGSSPASVVPGGAHGRRYRSPQDSSRTREEGQDANREPVLRGVVSMSRFQVTGTKRLGLEYYGVCFSYSAFTIQATMHGGLRGKRTATGSGVGEFYLLILFDFFYPSGCLCIDMYMGTLLLCQSDSRMSNWFCMDEHSTMERLQWNEGLLRLRGKIIHHLCTSPEEGTEREEREQDDFSIWMRFKVPACSLGD